MKKFKKIISIIMIAAVIASVAVVSTVSTAASGTGAGLAEWALNAYYSGWSYVWGGDSPGAVDCSGLITSYCGGNRTSMLSDAQANGRDWGYVSSGIPRVHGLGLSRPNHVGVYIGDNMEVDARGSAYGVCYQEIGGYNNWTCWFKLTAITYPYNGWEEFNGDSYYYENGEYIVNTSRTIDGVTYSFDSKGRSSAAPSDYTSTSVSTDSGSSASSSGSNDTGALKKGSSGSRVEELQARLQELGYYSGVIDGNFGENTEAAFKLFQRTAGLYVDGIAGADADALYADDAPAYITETETEAETEDAAPSVTIEKADAELAGTGTGEEEAAEDAEAETAEEAPAAMRYAKGDFSDDIALVQEKLIALGYLTGTADGEFGSLTEEAVKAFQTANGITASGIVEQDTFDKLFSETAVAAKAEERPAEDTAVTANPGFAQTTADNSRTRVSATASAPNTDVEVSNSEMSSKAVAAVAESPIFRRGANATNFEFLLWLAVMIVVMLIAFSVVYVIEKKRQRRAYQARRYS